MSTLLGSGLEEIGLAVFTATAPSGALAYAMLVVFSLIAVRAPEDLMRIRRYLIIPLGVAMVGFVSSAFQLGTPANALYVFCGAGRSPMSNEVFAAVLFLGLAGVNWLACFSDRLPAAVSRAWLLLIAVAAVACVGMISVVYAAPTIPTWSASLTPAVLWSLALSGSPLLSLVTLRAAGFSSFRALNRVLLILSCAALVASCVLLLLWFESVSTLANSFVVAAQLSPSHGLIVALFAVLGIAGLALCARAESASAKQSTLLAAVGAGLVLLGILLVRVDFYSMYMTVGF